MCTMAQVPTPPESRQTSASPELQHRGEGAVDVDRLLERYLGLLDWHQTLQADLAKQLSSVRWRALSGEKRERERERWQCADIE